MTRFSFVAAGLAALALVSACGSDSSGDDVSATLAALRIEPATFSLEEGTTAPIAAIAKMTDGAEKDVTAEALFTVEGFSVAIEGTELIAREAGTATVTATFGGKTATAAAEVTAAPIAALAVQPPEGAAFKVGTTVQLQAVATWENGYAGPIVGGVTWTSSNEAVATVDANGLATIVAGGPVTFTASARDLEATFSVTGTCDYPKFSPELVYDRVVPPLSWPAKWPDGTEFTLDLRDVHCNADWKHVKTFTVVLSAGWCTPCTLYAQRLENEVEALRAKGMEILIVEVQDTTGDLADLEFAYSHLDRITGTIPAIAAGDADTQPTPGFLNGSAILRAFPSVFVVRTRDMRIIADQNRANSYLPLLQIAENPEGDWSNTTPVFKNNCQPGQDGVEPNDTFAEATPIEPGSFEDGICTDGNDFFKIDLEGEWTVRVEFDHDVGDLDVFVWDTVRDQPAQSGSQVIGSSGSGDVEEFSHSGPAIIAVQGYRRASAPYTLTLTAH